MPCHACNQAHDTGHWPTMFGRLWCWTCWDLHDLDELEAIGRLPCPALESVEALEHRLELAEQAGLAGTC